jgi:hypothetical protein
MVLQLTKVKEPFSPVHLMVSLDRVVNNRGPMIQL